MLLFKDFSSKVRLRPIDVSTDNFIFKLHYRLTFWFLLASCLLVSSRQFINSHIDCIAGMKETNVINTFCFFSTTFTVSKLFNSSMLEIKGAAHPGVGPYVEKDGIVRHAYYQWVPFVLLLQAVMFAIPHKLWKYHENNRLKNIVQFLRTSYLTASESTVINKHQIDSIDSRNERISKINLTYMSLSRFRINRDWVSFMVICEVLNFINLIFQIWLNNLFLNWKFLELGWDWFHGEESALEEVFPKVTKCTFHKYGPGGSIQNHDAMCVMALNIINEKIYCIMWFWFACLLILNIVNLVWRLTTFMLHNSIVLNKIIWNEISPGPAIKHKDSAIISSHFCFSDWFFLYYLGKNMNSQMFRTLVSQIAVQIQKEVRPGLILDNSSGEDSTQLESHC